MATIDLRGGASAPLGAPPRVLVVVANVSNGAGASMVAASIADAACALRTAQGSPVDVALLYPCDDSAAADLKNGAADLTPTDTGLLAGTRASGARFVMPPPGEGSAVDDAAWFAASGHAEVAVVDVSGDDPQRWLSTPAAATIPVLVARPSIPSLREVDPFTHELSLDHRSVVAVSAATADTPELADLVFAGSASAPDLVSFFPVDLDLAITGVPAILPDSQLAVARDLLARAGALEGAPA